MLFTGDVAHAGNAFQRTRIRARSCRISQEIPRKFQTCIYNLTEEEKESKEIKRQILLIRLDFFAYCARTIRQEKDGLTKRGVWRESREFLRFLTSNALRTVNFYALLIRRCLRVIRLPKSLTSSVIFTLTPHFKINEAILASLYFRAHNIY